MKNYIFYHYHCVNYYVILFLFESLKVHYIVAYFFKRGEQNAIRRTKIQPVLYRVFN